MSGDLSNIHFESARIVRVIEDVELRMLIFEVSYPIPYGGSDFPQRRIIFQHYSRYVVDEGRQAGEPAIQRVEILETDTDRVMIRMQTEQGVREVNCLRSVLERDQPA